MELITRAYLFVKGIKEVIMGTSYKDMHSVSLLNCAWWERIRRYQWKRIVRPMQALKWSIL
jgi:hypothetical protein